MPEGDTIFRAARTLDRALSGREVVRFETMLVHLARANEESPLVGRTVERVESAGKHLLMRFSGELMLRTHMRMSGSWHVYRPGEAWQRPHRDMRIVIGTVAWEAVAFNVYDAELRTVASLAHAGRVRELGPDLLGNSLDADAVLRNVRERGAEPIEDVLLNQRVAAGIGNVYKSETLFLASVHPSTPADALDDERVRQLYAIARRLLLMNVAEPAASRDANARRSRQTTGRMNPADQLWVYSRGGRPCRRCGTPIASRKAGDQARVTYWCPCCQKPT